MTTPRKIQFAKNCEVWLAHAKARKLFSKMFRQLAVAEQVHQPTKQIADDVAARERLRKRGYSFTPCKTCRDYPEYRLTRHCPACGGRGGFWVGPVQ